MRILVVDGNSIVNRAFYGIRPLTNKDGQFTHAIYGFLNMLNKIERDENPDAVAIAFDLKAPTFRHKAYDGYKANRKGMPPELASQMPVLKELLTLLGYKLVTLRALKRTISSAPLPTPASTTATSALSPQATATACSSFRTKPWFTSAPTRAICATLRKKSWRNTALLPRD